MALFVVALFVIHKVIHSVIHNGLFPPTETDPCRESFPDCYIVLCRTFYTGMETEMDTETLSDGYCTHFRDRSVPILLYFNKGIGIHLYQWKNLLSTIIHVGISLLSPSPLVEISHNSQVFL